MDIKSEVRKLVNSGMNVGLAIAIVAKRHQMACRDVSAIYRTKFTPQPKSLPKPSKSVDPLWDWV